MSKKGYTKPQSDQVKQAKFRRKQARKAKDMLVCMEFYYDNRKDYTYGELNKLDSVLAIMKGNVRAV